MRDLAGPLTAPAAHPACVFHGSAAESAGSAGELGEWLREEEAGDGCGVENSWSLSTPSPLAASPASAPALASASASPPAGPPPSPPSCAAAYSRRERSMASINISDSRRRHSLRDAPGRAPPAPPSAVASAAPTATLVAAPPLPLGTRMISREPTSEPPSSARSLRRSRHV